MKQESIDRIHERMQHFIKPGTYNDVVNRWDGGNPYSLLCGRACVPMAGIAISASHCSRLLLVVTGKWYARGLLGPVNRFMKDDCRVSKIV